MSRVRKPDRFMNAAKYDSSITGPSKKVRIHYDGEDHHKAITLSHWLFVKYGMSYKTYRGKSKKRRDKLRDEFQSDTGVDLNRRKSDHEYEDLIKFFAEIDVPFNPDNISLPIQWED